MTLGPVMLDVDGIELSQQDKEIVNHPSVGGVILFSRNYHDTEQLSNLVGSIRAAAHKNILIAVDHEGGRVQRFINGFTRIPAMRSIGCVYDKDPKVAKKLATDTAWLMAMELRSMDLDFTFAPVVDIDYKKCEVIGDRAFHSDPKTVYELSFAFCKGLEQAGMASVAKHFPGHGAVVEDSHCELPVDAREFESIFQNDVLPFRLLIQNNLSAIMPAHVIYSKVDNMPAGFSRYWLQSVLREQLNFNGVIFSDDLNMHGASVAGEHYSDRANAAREAGCDMILICNNRAAAIEIVDGLTLASDPVSATRLARMHGRHPITHRELITMERWHDVAKHIQKYIDNPNLELEL